MAAGRTTETARIAPLQREPSALERGTDRQPPAHLRPVFAEATLLQRFGSDVKPLIKHLMNSPEMVDLMQRRQNGEKIDIVDPVLVQEQDGKIRESYGGGGHYFSVTRSADSESPLVMARWDGQTRVFYVDNGQDLDGIIVDVPETQIHLTERTKLAQVDGRRAQVHGVGIREVETSAPVVAEPAVEVAEGLPRGLILSQRMPEQAYGESPLKGDEVRQTEPLPQIVELSAVAKDGYRSFRVEPASVLSYLAVPEKADVDASDINMLGELNVRGSVIARRVGHAIVTGELDVNESIGRIEVIGGAAYVETLIKSGEVSQGRIRVEQLQGVLSAQGVKDEARDIIVPAVAIINTIQEGGLLHLEGGTIAIVRNGIVRVTGEMNELNGAMVEPGDYKVSGPLVEKLGATMQAPVVESASSTRVEKAPEVTGGLKREFTHPKGGDLSILIPGHVKQSPGIGLTEAGFFLTDLGNNLEQGTFRISAKLELPGGAYYIAAFRDKATGRSGDVDVTKGYLDTGVVFPGASMAVSEAGTLRVGGGIDLQNLSTLRIEKSKKGKTKVETVFVYGNTNIVVAPGLDPRDVIKNLRVSGTANTITINGETRLLKESWGGIDPDRMITVPGINLPRSSSHPDKPARAVGAVRAFYRHESTVPQLSVLLREDHIPQGGKLPLVFPEPYNPNIFSVQGKGIIKLDVPGAQVDARLSEFIPAITSYAGADVTADVTNLGIVQGNSRLTLRLVKELQLQGLSDGKGTAEAKAQQVEVLKLFGGTIADVKFVPNAIVIVKGTGNRLKGDITTEEPLVAGETPMIYQVVLNAETKRKELVLVTDPTRLQEITAAYLTSQRSDLGGADEEIYGDEALARVFGDALPDVLAARATGEPSVADLEAILRGFDSGAESDAEKTQDAIAAVLRRELRTADFGHYVGTPSSNRTEPDKVAAALNILSTSGGVDTAEPDRIAAINDAWRVAEGLLKEQIAPTGFGEKLFPTDGVVFPSPLGELAQSAAAASLRFETMSDLLSEGEASSTGKVYSDAEKTLRINEIDALLADLGEWNPAEDTMYPGIPDEVSAARIRAKGIYSNARTAAHVSKDDAVKAAFAALEAKYQAEKAQRRAATTASASE